jgi:proliferating cell nuclear antigen
VVDESRVHFEAGGVSISAVDPANVGMLKLTAHPSAFETFELGTDAFEAGIIYDRLESQLANARMGKATDDPVSLDIDGTRTLVTTEREYTLTTLTQTNEVLNIDPDSVREEPEVPNLSLPCEATVDVQALNDAVESVNRVSDYAVIRERDGEFVIAGEGGDDHTGEYGTVANFGEIIEIRDEEAFEHDEESMFSLSYLRNMAAGLKSAKVDDVTLVWGQKFPLLLEFERTIDEKTAYEGVYLIAPRVTE